MSCLAALLGFLGGGAAWALLRLIGLITNLALFQRFAWELPSFTTTTPSPAGPRLTCAIDREI